MSWASGVRSSLVASCRTDPAEVVPDRKMHVFVEAVEAAVVGAVVETACVEVGDEVEAASSSVAAALLKTCRDTAERVVDEAVAAAAETRARAL
jgi:hypothetical protein